MKHLDLTLATPHHNLACDEALLDWCEEEFPDAILRFWEPREPFVVLGYSNKVQSEVNLTSCTKRDIPVLRRCSGGGTVLQGAGCLNFSLILKIEDSGPLASVSGTNALVLNRHKEALTLLADGEVTVQGFTDLTIGKLKFAGNAQRRKRNFLLFHGTFLLHFDIPLVQEVLFFPSKQPHYRQDRPHVDFLMNLHVPSYVVKGALIKTWRAFETFETVPREKIDQLVKQKYGTNDWNFKF